MQILKVLLNESGIRLYDVLTATQSRVLSHIVSGKLTHDTASARELEVMDQLQEIGALDNFYEPTQAGASAAHYITKYGSREARDVQRRSKPVNPKDFGRRRYTDIGDASDFVGDDTTTPNMSDAARAVDSGHINR